jgi:hypothetical protein
MANSLCRYTLQNILDKVLPLGDVNPVLNNVSGHQQEPFLTICTDVYSEIVGLPFPHKWNEVKVPLLYTNSWQQDYALINPNGTSVFNVEWLSRGVVVNMTSNTVPKCFGYVECGRSLPQSGGGFSQPSSWGFPTFLASTSPNYMLYYGTWGAQDAGSPTVGNNPGPGSIYTNPLNATANSQPNNSISQVIDPSGNLQVVTTFGTCGLVAPNWPSSNAVPGTNTPDGTTVWTVVDPNGTGIRILPTPSQTGAVFQFNIIGQKPARRFTDLGNTLDPFPDKYEPYFRQGVIAQCYRYSSDKGVYAKFEKSYLLWQKSLLDLRAMEDRELDEDRFVPEQSVMGRGGSGRGGGPSAAWPFNGPGPGQA